MRRLFGLIAAIMMLFVLGAPARAQGPVDDLSAKAIATLKSTYSECSNTKFTECIVITPNGGLVKGTLTRMVTGWVESTDITVLTFPTNPSLAKNGFDISQKSLSAPPVNAVPPVQFWRTETFAVAGQANAGVLSAALGNSVDTISGNAFGDFYCGALEAHLTMSLFGTSRDANLVSDTQAEMKKLAQELGQALFSGGACNGTAQPPPPLFPAQAPVLAKISTVNGVTVTLTSTGASGSKWQHIDVSNGIELRYGDVICFKGTGNLVLTWYDGSQVTLNDPNPGSKKGQYQQCVDINLKQPVLHGGLVTDASAYLFEKIGNGAASLLRLTIDASKDPPEVRDDNVTLDVHGTRYIVGRDMAKGASIVCVEQGVVGVTPLNTSLAPFDVKAGNQVEVSATAIGPITPGCTLPPDTPVAQPDTSATGMTLQAARRTVIAGSTALVPVWLINSDNLANLNFALAYDPAVVQTAGDPVKGDLLDNTLFKANAGQSGSILTGLAQTSPLRGTGTVINIPFRATGQPGDVTELLLSVSSINDPSGGVLTINRIAGEITIAGPDGKVPSGPGGSGPGSTAGSAPGPNDIQKGDCDGDGFLTELDALCALEMSTQLRPTNPIMDMDNSGDVNSRDAVIILQKALGK